MIIWLGISPPIPTIQTAADGTRYWQCRSSNSAVEVGFTDALYAYNALLLATGVFLAVQTRKAFSAFRETQLIGFSTYTVTVVAVTAVPLVSIGLDLQTQFAIRSIAVL